MFFESDSSAIAPARLTETMADQSQSFVRNEIVAGKPVYMGGQNIFCKLGNWEIAQPSVANNTALLYGTYHGLQAANPSTEIPEKVWALDMYMIPNLDESYNGLIYDDEGNPIGLQTLTEGDMLEFTISSYWDDEAKLLADKAVYKFRYVSPTRVNDLAMPHTLFCPIVGYNNATVPATNASPSPSFCLKVERQANAVDAHAWFHLLITRIYLPTNDITW